MLQKMFFGGHFYVKPNDICKDKKSYKCEVKLTVETIEEDDWSDKEVDYRDYVDGTKVIGELSFDAPPLHGYCPTCPIKSGKVTLILNDGDESTKMSVYLIENIKTETVIPNKIRKFHWLFFAIDRPEWDTLGIFPKTYRGTTNMIKNKIFICTNFRGYWPTSVSSVIVAENKKEAKKLLVSAMKESNIFVEDEHSFEFTEIDIVKKTATIINDGSY